MGGQLMRKQDIEITISPSGEVSFTVKGVKGSSCMDETRFLEQALGNEVLEQDKTSEYYEQGESNYSYNYIGDDD